MRGLSAAVYHADAAIYVVTEIDCETAKQTKINTFYVSLTM